MLSSVPRLVALFGPDIDRSGGFPRLLVSCGYARFLADFHGYDAPAGMIRSAAWVRQVTGDQHRREKRYWSVLLLFAEGSLVDASAFEAA